MPHVMIVDALDNIVGAENRKQAQRLGHIVRIIRVFLFNSDGELFLQLRGPKIDFAGLWDQSVGGHVNQGEDYLEAANREMEEEIGIKDVPLTLVSKYYTETEYADGRRYKRFNSLYTTVSDQPLILHPIEVAAGQWLSLEKVESLIQDTPGIFTQGFIRAFHIYVESRTSSAPRPRSMPAANKN